MVSHSDHNDTTITSSYLLGAISHLDFWFLTKHLCVSLVFPSTDENMESNTCSVVGHCRVEMSIQWFPLQCTIWSTWDSRKGECWSLISTRVDLSLSMIPNCFFRSAWAKFMCLSVSQSPERIAALSCSVSSIPLKVSHGFDGVSCKSSPFSIFLFLLGGQ